MKKDFFNIRLDVTRKKEVLEVCRSFFAGNNIPKTIFFLNAHCFNIAQKNPEYLKAINASDLLLNDGVGIKLASLISGVSLKENLNGTDLIPEILKVAANENRKVFFLGGKEGVSDKAAIKATRAIPGLEVAGYHSGYFLPVEEPGIMQNINRSKAELLILGMGVPRQELWAVRNQDSLDSVKIIVAGGAILDFLSGEIKRAPLWLRKINMEWLYRFYLEPRRMWSRYVTGAFLFFYHLIRLKAAPKSNPGKSGSKNEPGRLKDSEPPINPAS